MEYFDGGAPKIPIGEKGYQVYRGGFYKEIRTPFKAPTCEHCGKEQEKLRPKVSKVHKEWVETWQIKELNIIGYGKDCYFYEYEYDTGNDYGDIRKDIDMIDERSVFASKEKAQAYIDGMNEYEAIE